MTASRSQAPVACQQWRIERFGKHNIGSVISGQIVRQFPNARQQNIMPVSSKRKIGQVGKGQPAAPGIDLAGGSVAPDHLRDFDIEQMRGMECLATAEQPVFDGLRCRGPEKNFEQSRGVDDDHARSRAA